MDIQKEQWEESYKKKDNFLFFPHEEIIRFFSKYISKRVGLHEYRRITDTKELPKVLDLGCGIGRHVIFANLMQTDAYGIELTQKAVQVAWKWAKEENMTDAEKKIVQGTITQMPFENNFFDFVVSHGVLDSMDLPIISAGIKETARVMRPGGYFYCDLIGQDNHHPENFHGAEIVKDDHEKGTIQFYYTEEFIKNIFGDDFEIVEMTLIKRQNQLTHAFSSRYHVIFKKK